MRHFFIDDKAQAGQELFLNEEDSQHLLRVLRLKKGKEISLANKGNVYKGLFLGEENGLAKVLVKEVLCLEEERPHLILCQGLAKGQKMETILKHCTEVGVDGFFPIQMERSVTKLEGKYKNKQIRYQKVVEEAAKQSNRSSIPTVGNLLYLEDIFSLRQEGDLFIACYEEEEKIQLEEIDVSDYKRVFCLIGPEGGFSLKEVEILIKEKVVSVSLGSRILRTETAAIVASYVLKRKIEGKDT